MNKFACLILLLISVSVEAQTSVYHPFPVSNTMWGYARHEQSGITGIWKVILTDLDTIINSVSYRKMTDSVDYIGGFREDTLLKIVYYFPKDSLTEQILYDFNLQIGDTVGPAYIGCYPYVYVSGIDSTNQFGNGYRKVYNLSGAIWAPYSLIEGIGTSGGLFVPYCMNDGYFYELHCFSINDSLIFWTGAPFINCNLPLNIVDNISSKSHLKIFPVPAYTEVIIEINSEFENSELRIYNIFGEIVEKMKTVSPTTKINIDPLSRGIYFCRIVNENGSVTVAKFVKG